jgi:hypothetical protein
MTGPDEPGLVGQHDDLGSIPGIELAHDPAHMGLGWYFTADDGEATKSHEANASTQGRCDMTIATTAGRLPAVYHDAELRAADLLARHGISLLRISLGLIFLGFGVLKFVPG